MQHPTWRYPIPIAVVGGEDACGARCSRRRREPRHRVRFSPARRVLDPCAWPRAFRPWRSQLDVRARAERGMDAAVASTQPLGYLTDAGSVVVGGSGVDDRYRRLRVAPESAIGFPACLPQENAQGGGWGGGHGTRGGAWWNLPGPHDLVHPVPEVGRVRVDRGTGAAERGGFAAGAADGRPTAGTRML